MALRAQAWPQQPMQAAVRAERCLAAEWKTQALCAAKDPGAHPL